MKAKILLFMMMALALVRCKDSESFTPEPDPVVFDASAFVAVEDLSGNPIQGVKITVGDIEGLTDDDGLLFLNKVEMNPSTYLVAERAGYFHGSRRFYPSEGKTSFIKLVLLPEQLAGTMSATAGGTIGVSGGIQLDFPANAVVDENGNAYTGTVSVYAQPIAADDPDLSNKMPGDLVGINEAGEQGKMASFGMVVAELRSASGDLLQVKAGSSVEMTMDVPASMLDKAPATIPMWYFDETLGLWKEEGEATLQGDKYVAQLGHFSYWNCDAWFEIVKWGATFVYENGSTASQVLVCLTILDLDATSCSYTNEDGFVCGMVASDELMLMEVKSPCGDVIYSQQIGPYSDTTMIGPITIPASSVSFTEVSGFAVNCDGNPVTNGYAKITVGEQHYYEVLDEVTGEFSISVMNCDESDITIKIVDETAFKQSLTYSYTYAPVIDAGTISVCETVTEFIDLEVVGLPEHYIFFFPTSYIQQGNTVLIGQDSSTSFQFFYVNVPGTSAGTFAVNGAEVGVELPNGDRAFANGTNMNVTITYYGPVGDYIIGTVTGTWHTGPNGQGGPDYPLAGTFSILRE
ncbi:MAG TPA: hypothetical protein VGK46_06305 [Saprospiraceae bacterium]